MNKTDLKKIYMVLMLRWGDPTGHSYVIGFFSNKDVATIFGCQERDYRGGKYEFALKEFEVPSESSIIYLITKELNPRQKMFYKVFYDEKLAKDNLIKQNERKIDISDTSASLPDDLKKYVLKNRSPKLTKYLINFGESTVMDTLLHHLDDDYGSENVLQQLSNLAPTSLELFKTFQQFKYRICQNEKLILELINNSTDIDCLIEFLKIDNLSYKIAIASHPLINERLINLFISQKYHHKVSNALIANPALKDSDLTALIKSNSLYLKAILREPDHEYSKEFIDFIYDEVKQINTVNLNEDDESNMSISPYFVKTIAQFSNTSTKILLELFNLANTNQAYKFLIKEITKHPNFNNKASLILETFKKL